MKLGSATLGQLPIATPSYARDEIGVGIVHFGVGGFHPARIRRCTSTGCWKRGLATQWGICGVGVMPSDRKMADVLDAQDGLYTLLLENPDGSKGRPG